MECPENDEAKVCCIQRDAKSLGRMIIVIIGIIIPSINCERIKNIVISFNFTNTFWSYVVLMMVVVLGNIFPTKWWISFYPMFFLDLCIHGSRISWLRKWTKNCNHFLVVELLPLFHPRISSSLVWWLKSKMRALTSKPYQSISISTGDSVFDCYINTK